MPNSWDIPFILREEFVTTEAFVSALYPLARRWGSTPQSWIFRGHGNSSWQLLPTAHRHAARALFIAKDDRVEAEPVFLNHRVDYWEKDLILNAITAFDEAGLSVPGEPGFQSAVLECFRNAEDSWPPTAAVPFMAFVQHLGVPTRLLDWTRRGLVAAYFAAEHAARHPVASGKLEVIALDWEDLSAEELGVRLVTAPRSSNPNLHAQAGVFTVANHETALDERLEKWTQSPLRRQEGPRTVMQRLSLPHHFAGELLSLLKWHGIWGASMFPDQTVW